jgi:hypothetical protein
MSKITLSNISDLTQSTTAQTTINTNSSTVQTAFDNTLSRDGTSPNQMSAALDMNNNQIINLPAPSTTNSPARLIDVTSNPTIVIPGTGTSGHVVPFLDGNNTFSGAVTFTQPITSPAVASTIIPQGRLTLASGVPVYTKDAGSGVSNTSVSYYTPYTGNGISLWNGTGFIPTTFSELSNSLLNSSVGNAGPFTGASNAIYDLFVWNNSGTPTLTRGDYWQQTATVTNTNANPAVFTHTAHGLPNGAPVRLTVSGGSLSPNFTVNTTYYVVSSTTNTYQLASVPGGAGIAAGGASSGTITATEGVGLWYLGQSSSNVSSRGTATALTRQNGMYVNNVSIPNGPAALYGLYVGSIATNVNGGMDYLLGSGFNSSFLIWNNYNRVVAGTNVIDGSAAYTYTSSTVRFANANVGNSITFLTGLREDSVTSSYFQQISTSGASGAFGKVYIGFDALVSNPGAAVDVGPGVIQSAAATSITGTTTLTMNHNPLLAGINQFSALESGDGTNANTFGASAGFAGGTLSILYRN